MDLDRRKTLILRAIVEDHVRTGLPVGSRAIARRYGFGVSPATIRNEMADLEDMGYLDKPHTSSGRIPSDKGYRYYVDAILPQTPEVEVDMDTFESLFATRIRDVVLLLRETVRLISETTNYLAFALGPDYESTTYKAIHLLPTVPGKALLVVFTDAGYVDTCLVEAPYITHEELQYVSYLLTEGLCNISLDMIELRAAQLVREEASKYREIVDQVIEFISRTCECDGDRLLMGGTANLLTQPEFKDVKRVRDLLETLENETLIREILLRTSDERDPTVSIGAENWHTAIRDLSIVHGSFRVGGKEGRIGIMGPKRMDYARALAVIKFCESRLSELLNE